MDFGNSNSINLDSLSFSLPPIPDFTKVSLKGKLKPHQFHIGAPKWIAREWVGNLYPPRTKATAYLRQASAKFDFIELNATSYNIPKISTLEKWMNDIEPTNIKLFPKVSNSISHYNRLKNYQPKLDDFLGMCSTLGKHVRGVLLQLVESFAYDKYQDLKTFIEDWPVDLPLYVELRHESWFSEISTMEKVFTLFRENHINTVITDTNLRRDVLHLYLTTPNLYIRFQSNDFHPTDMLRIQQWHSTINELIGLGLINTYFVIHNNDLKATHLVYDYCKSIFKS